MATPVLASFIDRQAEAFERAFAEDPFISLRSFLPGTSHPQYIEVLTELIRIDLELSWRRNECRRLQYYLNEFPLLSENQHAYERVAFEEYRQRRILGEHVTPNDYAKAHGIQPNLWPPIRMT